MRIYTRTGDRGVTGLFGGKRVSKASIRLHAYGTIDELNAVLGIVLADDNRMTAGKNTQTAAGRNARSSEKKISITEQAFSLRRLDQSSRVATDQLRSIQSSLLTLGADLATPMESKAKTARITQKHIDQLEQWIDEMEEGLPPLQTFILPGGSQTGANLHVARTVCRRAERWIVELAQSERINELILPFVNRLSDYLFVMARHVNQAEGMPEDIVTVERNT